MSTFMLIPPPPPPPHSKGRVSRAPGQKGEFKKQSVKYTAQKLYEKGVILEIEGLPNHQ